MIGKVSAIPAQFWQSVLGGPIGGSGTVANTATLTDCSTQPWPTLPANFLGYVGASMRLTAFGQFSTTGTPTLLIGFYYGGVGITPLCATAATLTGSGVTGVPWRAEATFTIVTTGTSGTAKAQGVCWLGTSSTVWTPLPMFTATLGTVTPIDTTSAKYLSLGVQWSSANASNTITCQQFIAESLV